MEAPVCEGSRVREACTEKVEAPDLPQPWARTVWGKCSLDVQALPITRRKSLLWALGFSPLVFRILWLSKGREEETELRRMRTPLAVVYSS